MASKQKNDRAELIKPEAAAEGFPSLPPRLSDATVARFFFIVSPGFESDAEKEIRGALAGTPFLSTVRREKGGVAFEAPLGAVLTLQPELKVVTRVLLRIATFGAKDFPKLHRKVQNLPWRSWLKPGVGIKARAASHRSRLRIKKRIEEVTEEAVMRALSQVLPAAAAGTVKSTVDSAERKMLCLIRMESDVATVSLDLSGELLHKRGDREDVGKAPLRESFAAAVVERSLQHLVSSGLVFEWLEPMAGTGVFFREYSREDGGSRRSFAGRDCLQIQEAAKMVDRSPKRSGERHSGRQIPVQSIFSRFTLIDTDPEQRARATELNSKVRLGASQIPLTVLGSASEWQAGFEPRFLVVNPPWGKRLKAGATNTLPRQEEFLQNLEAQFTPAFVACVMPALARRPRLPKGWEQVDSVRFRAGGVLVAASFFRIRSRFRPTLVVSMQSVDKPS